MRWDDLNWEHGRYSRWHAYGQTKLANLLFTGELQRLAIAAGTKLIAAAAHPGYAATHLSAAGPEMSGNKVMLGLSRMADRFIAQPDTLGALPQLYAATMPDVAPDDYFGPDGLGEQRGHPRRVARTQAASDLCAGSRLWKRSEELTGVAYPWP
jgi:NAD(P)-dependent dehydrogenase (short-subunit alcohol dehydrogenase family)